MKKFNKIYHNFLLFKKNIYIFAKKLSFFEKQLYLLIEKNDYVAKSTYI